MYLEILSKFVVSIVPPVLPALVAPSPLGAFGARGLAVDSDAPSLSTNSSSSSSSRRSDNSEMDDDAGALRKTERKHHRRRRDREQRHHSEKKSEQREQRHHSRANKISTPADAASSSNYGTGVNVTCACVIC